MRNSLRWHAKWVVFLAITVVFAVIPAESNAELVKGGITRYRIRAIQDLILAPNTAFNGSNDEVVIPDVGALGFNTLERLDQVGTQIEHINGFAVGTGFNEVLGNFTLTTGGPNFDPMTLLLTDVQQDETDPGYATGDPSSISFANIVYTVPNYGVRLDDAGVDLEVRDPFSFVGTFDGLPPSKGNLIADEFFGNNDRLAVYIAGTDIVVGWSANRRVLSAVPEPSSMAFLAAAAVTGAFRMKSRLRKTAAAKSAAVS